MISTILFLSLSSFAQAQVTVKVDSFVSTGRYTTTAELCGHVEGAKSSQQILVVSDPNSKGPGKYIVLTTPAGEFCAVISTATGTADASLVGSSSVSRVSQFSDRN